MDEILKKTFYVILILLVASLSPVMLKKESGGKNSKIRHDHSNTKYTNDSLHSIQSVISGNGKEKTINNNKLNGVDPNNISLVLDNLLKTYESSQLPNIPTLVQTNILIRSMGPVSELDMDYSLDCYFRQYWKDSRLSFTAPIKSLSLSIKMLERIWRPDTYIYNGKQSHIHTLTVPNKLLRLGQDGDILYSMRLTLKASCIMKLNNFPMDRQSCPLIIGSYAHTSKFIIYDWLDENSVTFVPGMSLNQFDIISKPQTRYNYKRREGSFSVIQVSFNLRRHTGYFIIQVYIPCILIVAMSWVSFWIHREATSDRVGLGITTVLTLSTISLDARTDLPKVKYATALDWFLLMNFFYCIATLLEFAGVHYFTKIGSGEILLAPIEVNEDDNWEDIEKIVHIGDLANSNLELIRNTDEREKDIEFIIDPQCNRRSLSVTFPLESFDRPVVVNMETRTTQTDAPKMTWIKLMWLCFLSDNKYRLQRQSEASKTGAVINSVSTIDRISRVAFPLSFITFNILYWLTYVSSNE